VVNEAGEIGAALKSGVGVEEERRLWSLIDERDLAELCNWISLDSDAQYDVCALTDTSNVCCILGMAQYHSEWRNHLCSP
jgi:hypothetical protein